VATDMFMKIDDIQGESVDAHHNNEIEVISCNWGLFQVGSAHSGTGAGSGKVSAQDLTIAKYIDKASPNLLKLCCSGKHFKNVRLTFRKAGGKPLEYVELQLGDGLVSAIAIAAGVDDERLTETITLNFAWFKYTYTPQTAQGSAGGSIPSQWNIAKNSES
jgi:type VI secretion system secreted protein Hcp